MVETVIGWIGTVCLSCCGIPQCVASIKDKNAATSITYFYLTGWIVGVICMFVYIHLSNIGKFYPWPLQVANVVSLVCALILISIKWRHREKS